jgi:hypothetical protein
VGTLFVEMLLPEAAPTNPSPPVRVKFKDLLAVLLSLFKSNLIIPEYSFLPGWNNLT